MKILFQVLCTVLFIGALSLPGFAQRAKVVSAYNYLKYGELDKAKEAIDEACLDEKSIEMAKTWYYKGKIYHAIYDSKDPAVNQLDSNALNEAYNAYIKVSGMDDKGQYADDVTKKIELCALQFVNKGVKDYSAGDYEAALASFETALAINKMPEFNRVDTLSIYNAALTAERLKQYEKAQGYYKELINYGYGGAKIYSFLLNIYKAQQDTVGKLAVIQQGRNAFPDDNNLIIEELNYYIESGDKEKAISNLKLAIEKDPENFNLHYALGAMYDQVSDYANGETAYIRALELVEPTYTKSKEAYQASVGSEEESKKKRKHDKVSDTYFSILYNYGALYYNEGVKQIKKISTIADNVKYANEKKKAEQLMIKALPYLEKALELKPTDRNTLTSLRDLYARTGNNKKWEEMQGKLEN